MWTYLRESDKRSENNKYAWYKCDCGVEKEVAVRSVNSGVSKSCGCSKGKNITFDGKTQSLKQWSKDLNIHPKTLRQRLKYYKWSAERAFTEPLHNKRTRNIEFNGKTQNLLSWSKELKIDYRTLYLRIFTYGWSISEALSTPVTNQGYKREGMPVNQYQEQREGFTIGDISVATGN